jgi:pimeloyl-ACP methyl ester carboxylesterase
MPGCGHEPHRARPDVVVDAIASFLDEHGVLPVVRC